MNTTDTAQERQTSSFRVLKRSENHWDIHDDKNRLYCIRGERGRFTVFNEMSPSYDLRGVFRTVGACMAYICAELME